MEANNNQQNKKHKTINKCYLVFLIAINTLFCKFLAAQEILEYQCPYNYQLKKDNKSYTCIQEKEYYIKYKSCPSGYGDSYNNTCKKAPKITNQTCPSDYTLGNNICIPRTVTSQETTNHYWEYTYYTGESGHIKSKNYIKWGDTSAYCTYKPDSCVSVKKGDYIYSIQEIKPFKSTTRVSHQTKKYSIKIWFIKLWKYWVPDGYKKTLFFKLSRTPRYNTASSCPSGYKKQDGKCYLYYSSVKKTPYCTIGYLDLRRDSCVYRKTTKPTRKINTRENLAKILDINQPDSNGKSKFTLSSANTGGDVIVIDNDPKTNNNITRAAKHIALEINDTEINSAIKINGEPAKLTLFLNESSYCSKCTIRNASSVTLITGENKYQNKTDYNTNNSQFTIDSIIAPESNTIKVISRSITLNENAVIQGSYCNGTDASTKIYLHGGNYLYDRTKNKNYLNQYSLTNSEYNIKLKANSRIKGKKIYLFGEAKGDIDVNGYLLNKCSKSNQKIYINNKNLIEISGELKSDQTFINSDEEIYIQKNKTESINTIKGRDISIIASKIYNSGLIEAAENLVLGNRSGDTEIITNNSGGQISADKIEITTDTFTNGGDRQEHPQAYNTNSVLGKEIIITANTINNSIDQTRKNTAIILAQESIKLIAKKEVNNTSSTIKAENNLNITTKTLNNKRAASGQAGTIEVKGNFHLTSNYINNNNSKISVRNMFEITNLFYYGRQKFYSGSSAGKISARNIIFK